MGAKGPWPAHRRAPCRWRCTGPRRPPPCAGPGAPTPRQKHCPPALFAPGPKLPPATWPSPVLSLTAEKPEKGHRTGWTGWGAGRSGEGTGGRGRSLGVKASTQSKAPAQSRPSATPSVKCWRRTDPQVLGHDTQLSGHLNPTQGLLEPTLSPRLPGPICVLSPPRPHPRELSSLEPHGEVSLGFLEVSRVLLQRGGWPE